MTPFVAAELVLALVVLLVVGALTFVWARRRFISGDGRPVMLCARRQGDGRPVAAGPGPAQLGPLRVVQHRRALAARRRSRGCAVSSTSARRVPLADPIPGLADPVAVQGRAGAQTCEFAFVPAAYTAVRAWLESSPPGFNVNVA